MSGVFGSVFIVAFAMAFDGKIVAARQLDDAEGEIQKRAATASFLLAVFNVFVGDTRGCYGKIWAETKGDRFLVPLGGILCLISAALYHYLHQ